MGTEIQRNEGSLEEFVKTVLEYMCSVQAKFSEENKRLRKKIDTQLISKVCSFVDNVSKICTIFFFLLKEKLSKKNSDLMIDQKELEEKFIV